MKMKEEDKYLYQAIDDILWSEWDPIGLNDNEEVRDEYQRYTSHIFTMKKQGADSFKIAEYLYKLESVDMGISRHKRLILDHLKIIAQKIVDL